MLVVLIKFLRVKVVYLATLNKNVSDKIAAFKFLCKNK